MNFPDHPLLKKSLNLLRENPTLTTDQIPDQFLNVWALSHISEAYSKEEILGFAIFMIIFSAHNIADQDSIQKSGASSAVTYDSDIDIMHRTFCKFQQTLMAEQICRKLAIKMTPVRIFDIDNYPGGIQLAITRSEVEKAKVFQMEMKKRGIDF